jgi:asparagine synthase (glutamine-hydrolysing)
LPDRGVRKITAPLPIRARKQASMCGIVAVHSRSGKCIDSAVVRVMRDALHHRGPDDEGLLLDNETALGHRRLAIVDLSDAGRQPMPNEDESLWLIYNGEIYNYVELAAELRSKGHRFRSETDSEVILHLFEEEGAACVKRLNGMFAFVIWDRRRRTLFMARDRIGIKPLYYYTDDDWFLCASEVKALLAHPAVQPRPDIQGLADYLYAGFTLGEKTMIAGVRQLPPGHTLEMIGDHVVSKEYWSLNYAYRPDRSFKRTVADLSDLLDDAARIHCRSDADLGCHLSGGLDSSLVTTLATRHRAGMKTFSIRFDGGEYFDETEHACAVSRQLATEHFVEAGSAVDLDQHYLSLLWHQDQPMPDASGYSYYAISRLAARHVKVALTGHGGDEIFAGYPAQFALAFGSTAMFDLSKRTEAAEPAWYTRAREAFASEGVAGLVARVGRRLVRTRPEGLSDTWAALHCGHDPSRDVRLDKRFRDALSGYSPHDEYVTPLICAPTDDVLDKALHHDLRVYLPHLLHKEDRASMAVSLESRVPLLDHRVVEFLATVPTEQKVAGMLPKALLRAVARPMLPESILQRRDKSPFPSPERQWLSAGRLPLLDAVLSEERTLDRGIFSPDALRRGNLSPGSRIAALNIELWFRLFIDQDRERLRGPNDKLVRMSSPDPLAYGTPASSVAG